MVAAPVSNLSALETVTGNADDNLNTLMARKPQTLLLLRPRAGCSSWLPSFRLLRQFKWSQKLPTLDPRHLLYGVCTARGASPCLGVLSECVAARVMCCPSHDDRDVPAFQLGAPSLNTILSLLGSSSCRAHPAAGLHPAWRLGWFSVIIH